MGKKWSQDYSLTIQNSEIYNHFFDRMVRIVLSQIGYKGLPATCDRLTLERSLLRNGTAAIGRPKGCNFWVSLPYTSLGYLDVYKYPTEIRGYGTSTALVGVNNEPLSTVNIDYDEWEIFYDNPTMKAPLPTIKFYAKMMYEIYQTLRSNLRQQRTPYIVLTDNDSKLSYDNIMMKLDGFENVLTLRKGQFDPEAITTLDTRTEFKGKEIMDLFDRIWDMFCEDFGITIKTDKRERMTNSEVDANKDESEVGQNIRLIQRAEACNRLNKLHNFASYNEDGQEIEPYMISDVREHAKTTPQDMAVVMSALNSPESEV